ncbi:MAG: ribonuclease HI [Bernardetiaceae bacterium]|nr:ribonuclease HI [Bernardetiaceae bacterium]
MSQTNNLTNPNLVELYTDGASRGNPGPGGYGVVLISRAYNRRKEFAEGFKKTTNNRMELLAVIIGLEALRKDGMEVHVYSDSKYVVDAVEKKWILGWEKKNFIAKGGSERINSDLWRRFLKIYRKHKVVMHWVKGHAGHPLNERCDALAVEAALSPYLKEDKGYVAQNNK